MLDRSRALNMITDSEDLVVTVEVAFLIHSHLLLQMPLEVITSQLLKKL
jgi:hypothetical protein